MLPFQMMETSGKGEHEKLKNQEGLRTARKNMAGEELVSIIGAGAKVATSTLEKWLQQIPEKRLTSQRRGVQCWRQLKY